tara:strand:+ start:50 stop:700 length:651 start_codon:yes stop_codon:yes gene_type:complete
MSTNRNQKAYIRIDGSGRDVAGSLILRNKKPGNGKWREVLAYECCNFDPTPTTTTTTTAVPLAIGTFYSGGIIASSTIIEGRVMIADLNDLGQNVWNTGPTILIGTSAGLTEGEPNTSAILTQGYPTPNAASVCRAGIIPWDLPSKDELNELYVNLTAINAGISNNGGTIIANDNYWSSTENDSGSAWFQVFNDGNQFINGKSQTSRVRAVRWVNI